MHQVHQLIHQYGDLVYLIVFIWTALEGETFVIIMGLAAQKGVINVWLLFVSAFLGSMCGDQVFFFLGRKYGTRILEHMPKLKPGVERALGWLEKYAIVFILSYRFMYGLRNVSGVAVGLSHLPWKKFTIWNAVAAFVWAASFVGFGYLYGSAIDRLHRKDEVAVEASVNDIMLSMLALFAFIIAIRVVIVLWQRHRNKRK